MLKICFGVYINSHPGRAETVKKSVLRLKFLIAQWNTNKQGSPILLIRSFHFDFISHYFCKYFSRICPKSCTRFLTRSNIFFKKNIPYFSNCQNGLRILMQNLSLCFCYNIRKIVVTIKSL